MRHRSAALKVPFDNLALRIDWPLKNTENVRPRVPIFHDPDCFGKPLSRRDQAREVRSAAEWSHYAAGESIPKTRRELAMLKADLCKIKARESVRKEL
jgi:hypothetical protein